MAQDIRALMRNDEWIAIESWNAQLAFIRQFAKTECGIIFDTTGLAELFKFTRARMPAVRAKRQRKHHPPYRPLALPDEQEFEPCQMIPDKAVTGNYVRKRSQSILVKRTSAEVRKLGNVDPRIKLSNFLPCLHYWNWSLFRGIR
jgi:hypothetical protein